MLPFNLRGFRLSKHVVEQRYSTPDDQEWGGGGRKRENERQRMID